ncbi:hypothetical protein GCM10023340_29410 [Nocardioides marinquilinus]|uniref:DUF2567 domain-containing protein n=1 Tax=Nocardioides marinquilinus TaxID=1210400 RepID=A0ABP9PYD4_9ACTN
MTTAHAAARQRPSWAAVRPHLARVPWRGSLVEAAVVLLVFAAVAVGAAWLWHRLANPADGTVLDGRWVESGRVQGDFLVLDFDDLRGSFGIVGWYAVIGLVGGVLLGTLAALACRRSELVTLVAVAAGSVLAAYVCLKVGGALGPADPNQLAATADPLTVLPGRLGFDDHAPLVVWPLGALLGLALTYLLTTGVDAGKQELERLEGDDRRWLSRNPAG